MKCPYCKEKQSIVKAGLRHTKKQTIQKYYCKKCKKYYSDAIQPYTHYPIKVILYSLESYNRGYPIQRVKNLTGKKYRCSPPSRTIYSWIKRYQDTLTMLKMRKKYTIHPENLITAHRFNHQQIYPFTYHNFKRFIITF